MLRRRHADTYIAALDSRIQAAAPACYINSWDLLLDRLGPQDGEQTFAHFLTEGLDIADYVELFAPKPYLIASTIEDFFPLEGARQTFEEARTFYRLFKAADRVNWFIGRGLTVFLCRRAKRCTSFHQTPEQRTGRSSRRDRYSGPPRENPRYKDGAGVGFARGERPFSP